MQGQPKLTQKQRLIPKARFSFLGLKEIVETGSQCEVKIAKSLFPEPGLTARHTKRPLI